MTTWTPETAAAKGSLFLDEKEPGWFERIDVASLSMNDSCHCIGGQLFGNYSILVMRHLGTMQNSITFGFNTPGCSPVRMTALTAAWRDEIARRRLAQQALSAQDVLEVGSDLSLADEARIGQIEGVLV